MNERDYWDSVASKKDVMVEMGPEDKVEEHLKIITDGVNIKGNVLELGCGVGRLLVPLADKYPKATFYGIDISSRLLALAPTRKNITYSTTYTPDKTNFAYSMLVFQHITTQEKKYYIEMISRLLTPGGIFRFQYVTGDYDDFIDHNVSDYDIGNWCKNAGLDPEITKDKIEHYWSWCKAVKV